MILGYLLLFTIELITLCNSKVVINLRIYNYQNGNDVKSNGGKCENFHWIGDSCDPMFDVCITSKYRCDVLNHFVEHWKNKRYVYNVLSKTIRLDHIQRSLRVDVKVEDHDRFDAHDHIAQFSSHFWIAHLNTDYKKQMTVSPSNLNVHLFANINMRCENRYYGFDCERYCLPKPPNYDCQGITGRKICTVNCGYHGSCHWEMESEKFICQCKDGWAGDSCQKKHYENCSQMNRFKKCVLSQWTKECSYHSGIYETTCKEALIMSTITTKRIEITSTKRIEEITTKTTTTTLPSTTRMVPSTTDRSLCFDHPGCFPDFGIYCNSLPTIRKLCPKLCSDCLNSTVQDYTSSAGISTTRKSIPSRSPKTIAMNTTHTTKDATTTMTTKLIQPTAETETTNKDNEIWKVRVVKQNQNLYLKKKYNDENEKQQPPTVIQSPHYPTTIVIICLLLLLLISIVALLSLICGLKKKGTEIFSGSRHSDRPLPPVIYLPNEHKNQIISSVFTNSYLPDIPKTGNDNGTIPSDYLYDEPLLTTENCKYINDSDIYEEPIFNCLDSMTCETDLMDDDDNKSAEYEEPRKIN